MAKKGRQEMLFAEKDSAIAKACDALLDARDAAEAGKTALEAAQVVVIEELRTLERVTIKHNGRVFSIRESSPKTTVAIKE